MRLWRVIPTRRAVSSCVHPDAIRRSRSRLCTCIGGMSTSLYIKYLLYYTASRRVQNGERPHAQLDSSARRDRRRRSLRGVRRPPSRPDSRGSPSGGGGHRFERSQRSERREGEGTGGDREDLVV